MVITSKGLIIYTDNTQDFEKAKEFTKI